MAYDTTQHYTPLQIFKKDNSDFELKIDAPHFTMNILRKWIVLNWAVLFD